MDKPAQQYLKQLEDLVGGRQDWLFRFAYMRIGKREDAEDLVQEVFISLFRKIKSGTEIINLDQYMIRSISNACADYYRQHAQTVVPIDEAKDIAASEADRTIHDEYMRVNRILEKLPPEQAEIVRLKCYDSLTFRQIADLKDIPESTVKSRYRYAIKRIQEQLKS